MNPREAKCMDTHETELRLAHDLINKLSVVVGRCDLLVAKIPKDSPLLRHVLSIHEIAQSMAKDLVHFQDDLVRSRKPNAREESVA